MTESIQQPKQVIVAYGFEYDALIGYPGDVILCKCFESHNPFYAAPIYIKATEIEDIKKEIARIEEIHEDVLDHIKELAAYREMGPHERPCKTCWRTVLYYDPIQFNMLDINYESEGDENGDGR